jgi:hypothetical protein
VNTTTVEIPADVRDNSETVTDYAFMRHRSPDKGVRTVVERDADLDTATRLLGHRYDVYTWHDVNPDGQRCRFDLVARNYSDEDVTEGEVVNLFHTEYFTRVPCVTHDAYYAQRYASVTDQGGVTTIAQPYCGECMHHLRRSARESYMTVNESEPLLIGQHD